jgi:hypothetical protein
VCPLRMQLAALRSQRPWHGAPRPARLAADPCRARGLTRPRWRWRAARAEPRASGSRRCGALLWGGGGMAQRAQGQASRLFLHRPTPHASSSTGPGLTPLPPQGQASRLFLLPQRAQGQASRLFLLRGPSVASPRGRAAALGLAAGCVGRGARGRGGATGRGAAACGGAGTARGRAGVRGWKGRAATRQHAGAAAGRAPLAAALARPPAAGAPPWPP